MVTAVLESGVSSIALLGIKAYRTWISPYKGFRCAHHVLHEDGSCSTFGLQAFQNNRPLEAWRLLRERFVECRAAYETLLRETSEEREERRRRKKAARREEFSDYCVAVPDQCPPMHGCTLDLTPDHVDCSAIQCDGCGDIGSCN